MTKLATTDQPMLTQYVPTTDIDPNPDNIRHDLGDLAELAASIERHGIIEPLVGHATTDGRWRLIAGHRRLAAARLAGLDDVPLIVRTEPGRAELFELMLAENNQRAPVDPIAEAHALAVIRDETGQTVQAIAAAVNRSAEWVTGRLALLALPDRLHDPIRSGDMTLAAAAALARLAERNLVHADELYDLSLQPTAAVLASATDIEVTHDRAEWLAQVAAEWPGRPIIEGHPTIAKGSWRKPSLGWGSYGAGDREIHRLPEMDPPDYQVIQANPHTRTVTVWHTAPETLTHADFTHDRVSTSDDVVVWPGEWTPGQAVQINDLPDTFPARYRGAVHTLCPGHARLYVPWRPDLLAVCTQPHLHADGDWTALEEAWADQTSAHTAASDRGAPAADLTPRQHPIDALGADVRHICETAADRIADNAPGLLLALSSDLAYGAESSGAGDGDFDHAALEVAIAKTIAAGIDCALDDVAGDNRVGPESVVIIEWVLGALAATGAPVPSVIADVAALITTTTTGDAA